MVGRYDVFLSHSSADQPAVEAIAVRLRDEAGLRPFLDKWALVPGESWIPALERALEQSTTVAVFFGSQGRGAWHDQESQLALVIAAEERGKRVIPVLLPGARKEDVGGFMRLRTWVELAQGDGFARLVAGVAGRAPAPGTGTPMGADVEPPSAEPTDDDDDGTKPEPGSTAWEILKRATSQVPGGKWVFGPVALGAASAVVLGLFLGSARLAFWATALALAFTVVFYAFAKGTQNVKDLSSVVIALVWFVTGLFCVTLGTLYIGVFWGKPVDLRHWVDDKAKPSQTEPSSIEWIKNDEICQNLRRQGTEGISRIQSEDIAGSAIFFRGVKRDDTIRLLSKLTLDGPLHKQREELLQGLRSAANVPSNPEYALFYDSRLGAQPLEPAYKSFLEDLNTEVVVHVRN